MEPDQAGIQSRPEPSLPFPSAFLRHALLLSRCFSETGSPRTRVGRDGFELAIFMPPRRECCGDRRASPCPVDATLGVEPNPAILFQCSHSQPREAGLERNPLPLKYSEATAGCWELVELAVLRAWVYRILFSFFSFRDYASMEQKLAVLTFWGCAQKVASCIALYNHLYHTCWKLSSFHTDSTY